MQFKCFKLHVINSFSSYGEIEKIEPKGKCSATVVSSHLKWKVFRTDSLRWRQVTWMFQMQEYKTATAFLMLYKVGKCLSVSSETSVISYHWSFRQNPIFLLVKNLLAKKGKCHREMLRETIKTVINHCACSLNSWVCKNFHSYFKLRKKTDHNQSQGTATYNVIFKSALF